MITSKTFDFVLHCDQVGNVMSSEIHDKIHDFFTSFPRKRMSKGDTFLNPGDEPPGVFYLASGKIRQYDITDAGNVVVVNVFKEGAHFPMSWALNNEENVWYFETVEDTTLHVAPKNDAVQFFNDNPDAMLDFLKRLCSGATGQQRRLAHLMGGGAYTRVMYELTVAAKRFGVESDGLICVEMSESSLGEMAGLSREAVSRQLKTLKKKDLIETSYKKICLKDIQKLEEELGFSV